MNLTVRDIINLEVLKGLEVVAGQRGLDKKVANVTVFDSPDAVNWLRGAEFVATNLYLFKETDDQLKLVANLAEKNAAALGIKLKRFVNSISDEVLKLADKHSLPIITIPYEKAWVDLINPIMAEILNRQFVILEKSNAIRRIFLKQVLEGEKLKSVVRILSELTGTPITLIEFTNRSVLTWPYFFQNHVNNKELLSLLHSKLGIQIKKVKSIINDVEAIVVPIEVSKKTEGCILVWETKELKELDLIAVEHATTVAALHIQQLKAVNETNQRFMDDFVRNLLKGEFSDTYLKQKAEELGWELGAKTQVLVVRLQHLDKEDWKKSNSIFNQFKAVVQLHYSREVFLGIDGKDKFIFLLSVDQKENLLSEVSNAIIETRTKILETDENIKIAVGIGEAYETGNNIISSYNEADTSCKVSMIFNKVYRYSELGPYALLIELLNLPETEKYLAKLIYPILNYDHQNQSDLFMTLEHFINTNCNFRETAKGLYVHHNTIRYRLSIVEKLLNVNIRNPETVLSLMLGVNLYKLNQQQ